MAKITFEVDRIGDVAYLTLGTGEPSYCEEFSDFILIERGMFSKFITGLRILNFKKLKSGAIHFDRKDIRKAILEEKSIVNNMPQPRDRRELLDKLLKKVDKGLAIAK